MQKNKITNFVAIFICILVVSSTLSPTIIAKAETPNTKPSTFDPDQDFHIDKNGNVTVHQAKVMQIAGTSFYIRYYIGLSFIRMVVKTDKNTKVFRRFGDEIPLSQINTGDTVNIDGFIENGSDSLSIIAGKIVDFSNLKGVGSFKGTVTEITEPGVFKIRTSSDIITINASSTTQIRKGSRIIGADLVKIGDVVTDTTGTYDHATKILDANVIVVYIDKNIFVPRNFEGTLKSVGSGNPPTLVFNTGGKDYTVTLTSNTTILNKIRNNVSIKRYLEGDTIRIYGAIRESEDPIIDAQIVRNISLQ